MNASVTDSQRAVNNAHPIAAAIDQIKAKAVTSVSRYLIALTAVCATALTFCIPAITYAADGYTYEVMSTAPAPLQTSFVNPVINNVGQVAYVTNAIISTGISTRSIHVSDGVTDTVVYESLSNQNLSNKTFYVGRLGLDDQGNVSFLGQIPDQTAAGSDYLYRISNGVPVRVDMGTDLFAQAPTADLNEMGQMAYVFQQPGSGNAGYQIGIIDELGTRSSTPVFSSIPNLGFSVMVPALNDNGDVAQFVFENFGSSQRVRLRRWLAAGTATATISDETLTVVGNVTPFNDASINNGGVVSVVTLQAPGLTAGTVLKWDPSSPDPVVMAQPGGSSPFSAIEGGTSINDSNQIVFSAREAVSGRDGLFVAAADGTIVPVIYNQEPLVAGGSLVYLPTMGGAGRVSTRSLNNQGQVAFTAGVGGTTASAMAIIVATPVPVDTTGPVIDVLCDGVACTNGWYTSDVSVTWTVTDEESAITDQTGCAATALTSDTTGTTFTCSATSSGGTSSLAVTIRRDATAPIASATALPIPNTNGWNNSDVTVTFSGTDATSGIASCTAPATLAAEGAAQSSPLGTCTDNAGNASAAVSATGINIDKTAPAVMAVVSPPPDSAGWNTTPVVISFNGTDGLSGIAVDGCTLPITLSSDGAGQSAMGSCVDLAGNSGSATASGINIDSTLPTATATPDPLPNANGWNSTDVTVTFTGTDSLSGSGVAGCSDPITLADEGAGQIASGTCADVSGNVSDPASVTVNIDKGPPEVSIVTPGAGATYLVGQQERADYACTDTFSPVITCAGTTAVNSLIYTATVGAKDFDVVATDAAGLNATQSVSYNVVTAPGVDQEYAPENGLGNLVIGSTQTVSQTFTTGITGTLWKIEVPQLREFRCAAVDDLVIALHATASGIPTGSALASVTLTPGDIPDFGDPFSPVLFDLAAAQLSVTQGDVFALVISSSAPIAGCSYFWAGALPGTYPDGDAFVNGVVDSTRDMSLRTFVSDIVPDNTAPEITPAVVGTLGTNGWYTSNVDISWTVTDLESAITSQVGCDATSVTSDTTGVTFTCEATSSGGLASASVTILRDATQPNASATPLPLPNANGWNNTDVTVSFGGSDATSGIASCDVAALLNAEGTGQSASGTCTDNAGNVSAIVTASGINIDKTVPLVSGSATPLPNASGWNNTPVVVTFIGTDALSGVAIGGCTAVVVGTEGAGQSAGGSCSDLAGNVGFASYVGINIDLTPPSAVATANPPANANGWNNSDVTVTFTGTDDLTGSGVAECTAAANLTGEAANQNVSGTCTDIAGNASGSATASISIDKTAPTVTIVTPADAGSYNVGDSVIANYSCSDSLAGLDAAGCVGPVANGAAVDTSVAGSDSFVVNTADLAGNAASTSANYQIRGMKPFTYRLIDLGTFGGTTSTGLAISENGRVTGFALTTGNLGWHAFINTGSTLTDLGTLGGTQSVGTSINANGQVAGYSYITGNTEQHAFISDGTAMIDLGTLGGTTSSATAINASGQTTGYAALVANSPQHAFISTGAVLTDLGTLSGANNSYGYAINTSGQVTGWASAAGGTHAFISNGTALTDLGTFGGTVSYGLAINDSGEVAGWAMTVGNAETHAFVTDAGVLIDLGTFGGTRSEAVAINMSGQVTGFAYTAGDAEQHALFSDGTTPIDIGTLGGSNSVGNAINNNGQVTGWAETGAAQHAFLWDAGTLWDVNELVDAADPLQPYVIVTDGRGINDLGQVIAQGFDSRNGQTHAYLVTPVMPVQPFVISQPSAGSVFSPSDVVTVRWTGGDPYGLVNVSLIDAGANTVADTVGGLLNTGTYDWTFSSSLPFGGPCGHTYRFYVENVERTQWAYGQYFSVECDTTAPEITPIVTGTFGANGWYTSNVDISWTVTDLESAITSTVGCDATSIISDTTGNTFTCEATSGGGPASASVTITRDATPPSVSIAAPNGDTYAQGTAVSASYSCADLTSGVAQCVGSVPDGSPIDTSTVGSFTFTVDAADQAGNMSSLSTIYTIVPAGPDITPPVVTPIISGPLGDNGWYVGDVTLTWLITDAQSGIAQTVGCDDRSMTTDTRANGRTFACRAFDTAGNQATQSVTIMRDATPPNVVIPRPRDGQSWPLNLAVSARYICSDRSSGVAACDGTVPSGSPIDTSTVGPHIFTVTARDAAGNTATSTTTYQIL